MKTIGFADYYLSEWHADNYPAWIEAACKKHGLDYRVGYAWAEREASPMDGKTTEQWCAEHGVQKCESLEELCEKSDCILILAPSDPDRHLGYAQRVLPFGKRTYIDKTFAPDFATAQAIFELAKKYGTPFFSTSALRYATELDALAGCECLVITGGGSNFEEYIIHQIEPIIKLLQAKPLSVCVQTQGNQAVCRMRFEGGKAATAVYADELPFTVCAEKDGAGKYAALDSDFFGALMADLLRFFESGTLSFDPVQTLDAMKIRQALIESKDSGKEILL